MAGNSKPAETLGSRKAHYPFYMWAGKSKGADEPNASGKSPDFLVGTL